MVSTDGQAAWSSDAGSLVLQSIGLNPLTGHFEHDMVEHPDFMKTIHDVSKHSGIRPERFESKANDRTAQWTVNSCCKYDQRSGGDLKCVMVPGTGRNVHDNENEDVQAISTVVCDALGEVYQTFCSCICTEI
eukprot:SAG31_NODE_2345_length_5903_cov_1.552895_7_plen_133_part_00